MQITPGHQRQNMKHTSRTYCQGSYIIRFVIYTSVFKRLQFDVNNTKLFVTFQEPSTTGININHSLTRHEITHIKTLKAPQQTCTCQMFTEQQKRFKTLNKEIFKLQWVTQLRFNRQNKRLAISEALCVTITQCMKMTFQRVKMQKQCIGAAHCERTRMQLPNSCNCRELHA